MCSSQELLSLQVYYYSFISRFAYTKYVQLWEQKDITCNIPYEAQPPTWPIPLLSLLSQIAQSEWILPGEVLQETDLGGGKGGGEGLLVRMFLRLVGTRSAITFWVTCTLVLHPHSKFVTCVWILSTTRTRDFTCSIKEKSSILSHNRCYGSRPLMTVLQYVYIKVECCSKGNPCFLCTMLLKISLHTDTISFIPTHSVLATIVLSAVVHVQWNPTKWPHQLYSYLVILTALFWSKKNSVCQVLSWVSSSCLSLAAEDGKKRDLIGKDVEAWSVIFLFKRTPWIWRPC